MRRSELLSLPPRQINVELRYLQINDTKGNENRKIILNNTAIECISGLFDEESDFIFYSKYNHKPLRSIRKPWAKAKEKPKYIPTFSFSRFASTYISHLIMNGVGLFTVARQVGHKGLRMIEKVYGHLLLGQRQDGANANDGLFTLTKTGHQIRFFGIINKKK